jgi:hypothetical protein
MKLACALAPVVSLASLSLLACGGAPKPVVDTTTTTAAPVPKEDSNKTAAEKWAESKMDKEVAEAKAAPREGLDPLSESGALEAAAIPKIELTAKKELRAKSRGDLDAAAGLVKSASSVDQAVAKLTTRLGKPTWTENGQKRVWVAAEGARCHRLVLDADGSFSVEAASASEWSMLSALASQNPCTGEIKRGGLGGR